MSRILSTSEGTHRGAFAPIDWVLFVSIGAIWGSSFLLILIGLESFEPGLVTWLRVLFGAAALRLLPGGRNAIDRKDLPQVVALSILWVAIPFTLFPLAEQHVTSAVAGMINGGLPILATIIGSVMLRRPPTRAQIVGILLGSIGVGAIAISTASEGSSELVGVLMLLLAIVCYGFAINIAAPLNQRYGSLTVMGRMLVLGAIWTAPFGIASLSGSEFSWASFGAVLVLGAVGTGFAFAIMGKLVGRVGGTRAAFATYLIPVVAIALGVLLRSEEIAGAGLAGVVLVIAGAVLASRADRTPAEVA
jgi:drug/metabolite transporter (DMT)-like permease